MSRAPWISPGALLLTKSRYSDVSGTPSGTRQNGFALPHTPFSAARAEASRALRIGDVSDATIPKDPKTADPSAPL